ncbi:MAG: geranylgeranyl reductase family protein [Subdoligranulum sp.]|nr:geranylgeranyl reductase family protein [Subdoligranulum sp.]
MIYDALVIGAGPAGSCAGYWLAAAGLKTALVDCRKFPREKLCGGLLTSKTIDILRTIIPAENISKCNISESHVFNHGQLMASFQLLSETYTVRRKQFDALLVEAAQKKGVHTYFGASLRSIDFIQKEAYLSDGYKLEYSALIGADGVLSRVRRLAGLPKNEMGFCVEAHVPWELLRNQEHLRTGGIEIYYGDYPSGYGWVFPCEDSVAVGVGNLAHDMTEREILTRYDQFLSDILMNINIRPAGAYLPSGTSISLGISLYENLCLIGDAAGLIDPFTGEGIYYALLSAKAAADSIVSGKPAYPEYERRMNQTVYTIQNTVNIRNHIYSPTVLKHSLDFMQNACQYSERLIDQTIVRYEKTYADAYEEIKYYSR